LSSLVQPSGLEQITREFCEVRKNTVDLFKPLRNEDAVIQSNDFGSPPNWHIAHVTWFFHQILNKYNRKKNDAKSNEGQINLRYLNSYYQKYGEILPKSERGRFPRPTVQDTLKYRTIIEKEIIAFLSNIGRENSRQDNEYNLEDVLYHITLGNQHEMQHQELMVYDFQHYFNRFEDSEDNYKPLIKKTTADHVGAEITSKTEAPQEAMVDAKGREPDLCPRSSNMHPQEMIEIQGGLYQLGFCGQGFCYDNELPEHKVYLNSFKLDKFPVTNGQYAKFIEDGGYNNYRYWLADGWDLVQSEAWIAPLYWEFNEEESAWVKKDIRGVKRLDPQEPVTNVSYYEADAYAKWAGKRLPTEAEWEKAASWNEGLQKKMIYPWGDEKPNPNRANMMESYLWGPSKVGSYPLGKSYYGCYQMIGDVWEWTSSEYVLYPGYESKFEEYTDKWAINQKVLRGGCFATPSRQIRNSYRNYFRPHDRILFSGFRCAKDI
jgi:ergothioneine biosynthesis protein EgtB